MYEPRPCGEMQLVFNQLNYAPKQNVECQPDQPFFGTTASSYRSPQTKMRKQREQDGIWQTNSQLDYSTTSLFSLVVCGIDEAKAITNAARSSARDTCTPPAHQPHTDNCGGRPCQPSSVSSRRRIEEEPACARHHARCQGGKNRTRH